MNNANPYDEILPNLYLGSIKALGTYECKALEYYMVVDLIKYTYIPEKHNSLSNVQKLYLENELYDIEKS